MERVVLRWGDSVTGAHSLSLSLRVRFCWSPTGIIFERSEGTEKKDQHTQKWTHHFDCGVCCVTVSKALLLSLRGDNQIDIVTLETDARTHKKKKKPTRLFSSYCTHLFVGGPPAFTDAWMPGLTEELFNLLNHSTLYVPLHQAQKTWVSLRTAFFPLIFLLFDLQVKTSSYKRWGDKNTHTYTYTEYCHVIGLRSMYIMVVNSIKEPRGDWSWARAAL